MSTKFADKGVFFFCYFLLLVAIWSGFVFSSSWNPDYTAGELYDTFLAWQEKGNLYFALSEQPFRVLNYPPLFFYGVKALTLLNLAPLEAGRILSLLSGSLCFFVLYAWLKRFGLSSSIRLCILGFCASSFPLLYPLPQFHLQWTAIAFSFLGLYLLQPKHWLRTVCGCLLLVLACFTKQTQIITWGIGLMWIFFQNRKMPLLVYLTVSVAAFTGIAYLLEYQFGDEIWRHLFTYTVGTFSWKQLGREVAMHVGPWILFFMLGLWRVQKTKFDEKDLTLLYFLGQSLWLLSSAREGASYQYFMEWSLALLLWIAPLLNEQLPTPAKWAFKAQYILGIFGVSLLLGYHALEINKLNQILPKICTQISSAQSPILSDDPGLVRACGKIPALQPFIFHNLAQKNLWDESILHTKLQNKDYATLIFPFNPNPSEAHERWSTETLQVILQNYELKEKIGTFYLLEAKRN